ncbi:unnamed protein product [Schistocephalus solidus]|uniref:Integrase_H2C2 domain-containing protein n=1 Tax=Schistocephalus solidus TaxID=70667 RepID=A0A183TPL6_SCHSO|nr:unnamed protein product [Schistocephalus solidus]
MAMTTTTQPEGTSSKRVKRVSPKVNATNITDVSSPSRTFYICDIKSGRHFLIDTGAQISVIPPTPTDQRCPNHGLFLQAVNSSPIANFGSLDLSPGIDLAEMAAEPRRVGSPCEENVSGLQLQELPLTTGNGNILCDISTPSHDSCLPASIRRKVFYSLHKLSHPGIRATNKLVSDRFVWPGMYKELKAWTWACLGCQRSKAHRHFPQPWCKVQPRSSRHCGLLLSSLVWIVLPGGRKPSLCLLSLLQRWSKRFSVVGLPSLVPRSLS